MNQHSMLVCSDPVSRRKWAYGFASIARCNESYISVSRAIESERPKRLTEGASI